VARVRDRVRISLRLTLTLTINNDYTTLLISRLYCNIYISGRKVLAALLWAVYSDDASFRRQLMRVMLVRSGESERDSSSR